MPQCAVATCRNSHRRTRGRRIRYHRFPQIPEVRSRWVRACGRVPLSNGEIPFNIQTARICSLHFTNDSYEKDMEHLVLGLPVRSRLRRGAVPTIGVPVNVQPVTKMLVEDAKRSLLKVTHAKILNSEKTDKQGQQQQNQHGNQHGQQNQNGNQQQNQQGSQQGQQNQHGGQQNQHGGQQQQQKAHQRQVKPHGHFPQEQKMAGIDVLLALGLKPAPRLNKMHAMEGAAVTGKKVDSAEDKPQADGSRASPKVPQSQQNGAALPEETATGPTSNECLRTVAAATAAIKKEPVSESETEMAATPGPKGHQDDETQQQQKLRCGGQKPGQDGRKRKSTDRSVSANGTTATAPKKLCLEQREQYISSLVGCEKVTAEELAARAEQLRAEVQALDELARAKEMEWNEILSMRKLKEEAYLRVERRRQVMGYMEGNGQIPEASLSLGQDVYQSNSTQQDTQHGTGKSEKCVYHHHHHHHHHLKEDQASSEDAVQEAGFKKERPQKQQGGAHSQRQSSTPPKPTAAAQTGENGRKHADAMSPENRQIGEGRQGAIVDVRSIIADYRLRHPETVPRRGRRMRNSVNVGLAAGGAMVETGHTVDSRPSSTDSCKSNPNVVDPNNSMSFKDVLVQFAKLSQQQGEPVKTPQNYPDVTLHPVAPAPVPQVAGPQQPTGSLLHGILTKSQSPRPTTFSPTLARLLTAPERERSGPGSAAMQTAQQTAATQHLLQAYQGSNPVSISDLLSSSKARTEITITPVVNTPVQSHSNNLIHVDDVEEETAVIEDRESRISGGRDGREDRDTPPRCQGCHERAAQFVCAGCGNQWYCSRECQVAAWDEHSEVCSG